MIKHNSSAFSLMELMIVIAIMGILVSLALPSYRTYIRRAAFSEIVLAAEPLKLAVQDCFLLTSDLSQCNSGENDIPPAVSPGQSNTLLNSATVTEGLIQLTPKAIRGFSNEDMYELAPTNSNGELVWHSQGIAVEKGYAS